jgi:RHS repeat-associated protein
MNHRHVNKQTCNFSYNAENHLSGVAQVSFDYNGDGQRVVATEGITTTVFVGNCFKWQIVDHGTYTSTQITKYYYADGTRVAMQRGGEGTKYLLGDHLGSASVVLNADGTQLGAQGYRPWGAVNFTEGTIPTEYTFTGQFSYVSSFGMVYFNARWFLPELGRFSQPDTIIPEQQQGTIAWDRLAGLNNNPVKYNDPSGHMVDDGCRTEGCDSEDSEELEIEIDTQEIISDLVETFNVAPEQLSELSKELDLAALGVDICLEVIVLLATLTGSGIGWLAAQVAINPVLNAGNLLALGATVLGVSSNLASGDTKANIQLGISTEGISASFHGQVSFNTYASIGLTTAGFLAQFTELSLLLQALAVANDSGKLPFGLSNAFLKW